MMITINENLEMKKIKLVLVSLVAIAAMTFSCEDDVSRSTVDLSEVTPPSFEEGVADTITYGILNDDVAEDNFETFNWSKVDFGLSVLVSYSVEMSSMTTFSSANTITLVVTNDTIYSVTNGNVNETMLLLGLPANEMSTIYFRVIASPNDTGAGEQFVSSETIIRQATTFVAEEGEEPEPVGPSQFLVGSATDAGWAWDNPVELLQLEEGVFTGSTTLFPRDGDEAFRVFSTRDDWGSGTNYPSFIENGYSIGTYFSNAEDGDSNFAFRGPEATYTFVLDENNQIITLEIPTNDAETKFIVGDATQAGWSWDNPVVLTQVETGVFRTMLQLSSSGAFRVFSIEGDWGSGTNYPTYIEAGFTIDENFENAEDGDSNFSFTGADGEYIFTLDENNNTISLN